MRTERSIARARRDGTADLRGYGDRQHGLARKPARGSPPIVSDVDCD